MGLRCWRGWTRPFSPRWERQGDNRDDYDDVDGDDVDGDDEDDDDEDVDEEEKVWLVAGNEFLSRLMLCYYAIAFSSSLGLRKQYGLGTEAFCNIYMLDMWEDFCTI